MTRRRSMLVLLSAAMGLIVASALGLGRAQEPRKVGYKDTPMLPGGRWHVHDSDRPLPPIVIARARAAPRRSPASRRPTRSSSSTARTSRTGRAVAAGRRGWTVEDGAMVIKPGAGESPDPRRVRRLPAPPGVRLAQSRPAAATRAGATAA